MKTERTARAAASSQGSWKPAAPTKGPTPRRATGDSYERAADTLAANALSGPADAAAPTSAARSGARSSALAAGARGAPLPDDVRAFFEPRFGHDFSRVRIHADERAAAATALHQATALAHGNDVLFGDGAFAPQTSAGRAVLAHELAHVVQSDRGAPAAPRAYPWDEAQRRRELDPANIPAGLNYELRDHRLIAHTTAAADIASIVSMLDVLALYARTEIDAAAVRTALAAERDGRRDGDRVSIDVTPRLPAAIQTFLANMETYYANWRAYAAQRGTPEDIFRRTPQDTPERRRELERYYSGSPARSDEFGAACHQFAMQGVSGTASGVRPGRGAADPLNMDMDPVLDSYLESIHGRGPYRMVPPADVNVGDIAVFRAGRAITGLPTRIVHSAIVIRVTGGDVELLEKTDPHKPTATRTVRQVLSAYSSERATVHYLAPALAGLPFQSGAALGSAPPSGTFTSDRGTQGPEDTHVLFNKNTHVLRPHEDLKLFRLSARVRTASTVKVHGYASSEGAADYNFNLSAHRAVSIKDGLTQELPGGSSVEAIAHGATNAFGAAEQNRRAGIEVRQRQSTTP